MNTFKKCFPVLALLAVMCGQALAVTTFTKSISSGLHVIPASEHGFTSSKLSLRLYDSGGNRISPAGYAYTINATTKEVTLTAGVSGTLKITGPFDSTTSGSYDFAVGVIADSPNSGDTKKLAVCNACSSSSFAYRLDGNDGFVMDAKSEFSFTGHGAGEFRAWLEKSSGKIVWGYDGSSLSSAACTSRCEIRYNITAFPGSGIVRLGSVGRSLSGGQYYFGSVTDERPNGWQ